MGKIIAVVSGKGGTGKTTAVGALGACLGAMGRKTLCIDCDADLRNLDITLGISHYLLPDLQALNAGSGDFSEFCAPHPSLENLYFTPAMAFGSGAGSEALYPDLFDWVRGNFDYCLLDAPAGIGEDVLSLLKYADEALIVTTGDRSSIRDGQMMCSRLQTYGLADIRLLVNRVLPRFYRQTRTSVDDIIDTVGARLLGIIREDRDVPAAANGEIPLVLFSRGKAAQGFLRCAERLTGVSVPIPEK